MTVRFVPVTGGDAAELHRLGAGGKAVGLARLSALGVSVPSAVVLVNGVHGAPLDVEPLMSVLDSGPLAVRSSAVGEDGVAASFAGQFESVLNVQGKEALWDAIQCCLASLESGRAAAYRQEKLRPEELKMSVVIQTMIEPTFAGVLFTADPTTGRRDRMVLDYVEGLGEALVSGTADPIHILTDRDGKHCGPSPEKGRPQLSVDAVQQILNEGRQIAQQLEEPQDLEWAVDAQGTLWWVQARPITTLPEALNTLNTADVDLTHVYTRCNIGEMMPGAVTPLTMSVTMRGIDYGIQAMQVAVGVRKSIEDRQVFTAFFYGHSFLNLSAFGPMVRGVAGSSTERLCRALCGRPLEELDFGTPNHWLRRTLNGLRFGRYLLSGGAHRRRLARDLANLNPLQEGTSKERYEWIDAHLSVVFEAYDHHMTSSAVAGALVPALLEVLSQGKPPTVADEALCAALLSGGDDDGAESLDIAAGAQRLAQILALDEEAKVRVLNDSAVEAAQWLHTSPTRGGIAWRDYLSRHGHRAVRELELRQPEWRHDPTPLIDSLRGAISMVGRDGIDRSDVPTVAKVGWIPRILARKARVAAAGREATKSMLVATTVKFKEAYRGLGTSLVQDGLLDDADQIFFLFHEEIQPLIDGVQTLRATADQRRQSLEYQSRLSFPEVFTGVGVPDDPVVFQEAPEGGLVGKPVSPGCVEGDARVVCSVEDLQDVQSGEILIVPVVDVGWTPCFAVIAGLATEIGSAVSHGAVVAREYGVPAVVGLKGATHAFKTGQRVRLDANLGTLTCVEVQE